MLKRSLDAVPRGVVVLGFVSFLMDASSEVVHALLPLFLMTLGASVLAIGILEGVAESLALFVKVFSGWWSDRTRRRKPLLLLGYGLAALSKLVLPFATTFSLVVGARLTDRFGKGIRGAPRDALVADLAPPDARGASFGLRQALDTGGAIAGPLIAIVAMAWFAGDFRAVFWVAVIPALLCVALIVIGVHEPERPAVPTDASPARLTFSDARRLNLPFWIVTGIAAVLTLARFSEAFLVLRAQDVGMPAGDAPWVMVALSAVYMIVAFPAGASADRGNGAQLLGAGLAALLASDIVLSLASGAAGVIAGAALWGLHLALTQGLLAALVAAVAPPDLRGTAFGVFNFACGIALLFASALAGWLWVAVGPHCTFLAGAGFTTLAWIGLAIWRRRIPSLDGRK